MHQKRFLMVSLLALMTLMVLAGMAGMASGRGLLAASFFAPDLGSQPESVACRPHQGRTDQVRVEWTDSNDGSADYNIYRKAVSDNSYGDPVATVTESDGGWRWVDENAGDGNFQYRVTAVDGDGETTPGADQTCREPLLLDDGDGANFRVFYHVEDCPDVAGKTNCTPDVDEGGENQLARQVLDGTDDYRTEFMDIGFNDPSEYSGVDRFPIEMYPCNNGCANSNGIQYPPGNFADTDYDPATGSGDDYEVFIFGHELFHKVQGAHGGGGADPFYKWLIEGQARMSEDKSCVFGSAEECRIWDEEVDQWYIGQVNAYLGNPEKSLMEHSYNAALFWAYVTEQFAPAGDQAEPRYGMDVLVEYWEQAEENKAADNAKDGIRTLNDTLANPQRLNSDRRFKDIFQDFAVANYAKDLITNPASEAERRYNYIDEENCASCEYDPVKRTVQETLNPDGALLGTEAVQAWGARYFEFELDPNVPSAHIEVETLPATPHALYYHVLAIKNDAIVEQWSETGDSFELNVFNIDPTYDRLALIVVGLENDVNFDWGVNLSDGLFINTPNAQFVAMAGMKTSPRKIMIQLEVVGADQQPLAGIDVTDFEITIEGTVVNPPANPGDDAIVSSTYNAGKYWIILRAPDSVTCDLCDLTVSYGPYTDTEVDAISYGSVPASDNVIVIDRSGSMEGAKIEAAQNAASLYVDSYDTGDRIGVVSFNDEAVTEYALTGWNSTTRLDAQASINGIAIPDGGTANGAGMRRGLEMLDAQDSPNPTWSMVLLSDGKDTADEEDDHIPAFLSEYKDRVKAGEAVPIIHVVAVGDDADGVALQSVTARANGLFQWLPEASELMAADANNLVDDIVLPLDLSEIYRVFAESITGEQQIYAQKGSISVREQEVHTFNVDGGASQLVVSLPFFFEESFFQNEIVLRQPDSTAVPVTLNTDEHYVWRVPAPMAGEWSVTVRPRPEGLAATTADLDSIDSTSVNAASANAASVNAASVNGTIAARLNFLVEAALISDLTMEAFLGLPPEERIAGKAMPLLVALSDTGPLSGASVQATVARTDETLTLFDDGLHGDGAAGDGFYGGLIKKTQQPGGYSVVIDADGDSALFGPYDRRARVAFYMVAGPDNDDDGASDPNEGECMDINVNDTAVDHDGDGIPSGREIILQTDPCDPDTDDGGESDGSEIGVGKDPLNPSDDGRRPPTLKAWAGTGKLSVYLSEADGFPNLTLYRAESTDGPFVPIAEGLRTGLYEDKDVSNGLLYCYRAINTARGLTSAPSNVSCATPQLDPHAPHGIVGLPTGVVEPVPLVAVIHLDAEDNPETEEHMPFDGELLDEDSIKTGVVEMQVSNRADFEGVEWEPYRVEKEWTFAPDKNNRATVYVRYRDGAGNVSDVVVMTVQVDPSGTPTPTSEPSKTPTPTPTLQPDETPTPEPSETPDPDETPNSIFLPMINSG